jgi:hypothetical protein
MKADSEVISYLRDRDIAIEFYAALCNTTWKKVNHISKEEQVIEKLKGIDSSIWDCSWRYAGGIIAEIRDTNYKTEEDYVDFYCNGNEGTITERVRKCFWNMGWVIHNG